MTKGKAAAAWDLHISPAEKGYAVQGSLFNEKENMLIRWKVGRLGVCVCVQNYKQKIKEKPLCWLADHSCSDVKEVFSLLWTFLYFFLW